MQKNNRVRVNLAAIPGWIKKKKCPHKKKYLAGKRIFPRAITGKEPLTDLMEHTFLAYNGARLAEGCRLFTERMLKQNVTVGMSLSGALTPAGLGSSAIVPLINAGFVDWIVSTGANLYHDLHYAFNLPLFTGSAAADDVDLKENDIVRIYDIFLGYSDCLMRTDRILYSIITKPEFQKEMGTAELHHLLGKYCAAWEKRTGHFGASVLAAAYRAGVPVFTSSPGDSTIGMNIAAVELQGNRLKINPSVDVNESTAIVLEAKRGGGKSGVLLIGGGSPKNFVLQTEPQLQEVLKIKEAGHDYFFQVTDARPDTGGLSGATPSEAVSWGKVNPAQLPDAVVSYLDATIALPILAHTALRLHSKRPLKKLYHRREELVARLKRKYFVEKKS